MKAAYTGLPRRGVVSQMLVFRHAFEKEAQLRWCLVSVAHDCCFRPRCVCFASHVTPKKIAIICQLKLVLWTSKSCRLKVGNAFQGVIQPLRHSQTKVPPPPAALLIGLSFPATRSPFGSVPPLKKACHFLVSGSVFL